MAPRAVMLTRPLLALLDELRTLLETVSPPQYAQRCGEQFFNATLGGHVRHCLDHVRALVEGIGAGVIDYEHRDRDTDVESDPVPALRETQRLLAGLASLEQHPGSRPVRVVVMPARDARSLEVGSTLARELAFVLSHTIHHFAILKSMAHALGARTPATFGFAPSTLAHQDRVACAP
jgi:uncharacterized damage-inducible protein DinB